MKQIQGLNEKDLIKVKGGGTNNGDIYKSATSVAKCILSFLKKC